jgi:integrase
VAKRKRGLKSLTLRRWVVKLWLPVVRSQLKESTFESYRRNLELHVLPTLGTTALEAISPRMLNELYVSLLTSGRRNGAGGGLSPKTVRYVHTIVHKVLADAVDEGLLQTNPAERAKAPKPDRTSTRQLQCWEPDHLARFLANTEGHPLRALWRLAAMTGMRRGELLGLQWADIDFDRQRLSIRRNIISVAYRIVETTPKSHHARVVDLDPATVETLRAHHRDSETQRPTSRDDHLFCGQDGRPLHPDSVTAQFRILVRDARLPAIRFHDLRHTHATLALRAGIPAKVIAERLGHATPEFTMHQYAHVLPGMQAEAATRVANLVTRPRDDKRHA